MKKFKIFLRNYFGFSKVEMRAMMLLMPTLLIAFIAHLAVSEKFLQHPTSYQIDRRALDSLTKLLQSRIVEFPQKSVDEPLAPFRPDTVGSEWLKSRGLPTKLIKSWTGYRKAGGRINNAADLTKLYGMNDSLLGILKPYIVHEKKQIPERKSQVLRDVNLADSVEFKKIYGIGPKLSARIVKYRDLLGGYVRMDQLYEVYGLDSVVVASIIKKFYISRDFEPRTIDLDSAQLENLAKHPYLTYREAKMILAYRSQHGDSLRKKDLLQLPVISTGKFDKLSPYLR